MTFEKIRKKSKKQGMTLMEVLIACAILPIVIFGATSMVTGMLRVSDKTNTGIDFLMTLDTIFVRIETDFVDTPPRNYFPQVWWDPSGTYVVADVIDLLFYRYSFADRKLVCGKRNSQAEPVTETIYSQEVLLPDAPLEDYDKNGAIDGADRARRDNCLKTLTKAACHDLGVQAVFGLAKDQNRVDFSFRSERHRENGQHGFTKSIALPK